jgi:hypothetical protein
MATRLAAQTLAVGSVADATAWTPTGETLSVTFTTVEVTATSVVRALIKDTSRVIASAILNGSSTKKLTVTGLETAVTVHMEQLQGSAQITASDGTGGDITADEIATDAVDSAEIAAGAVETAELAAGCLAASAAGRAKFADDFFTAAEFAAGAGGKFAADCLVAAGIDNLIADDAFTAANMAKFQTDCMSTAVLNDMVADDGMDATFLGDKIAANAFDAAACANAFAAGAIPVAKVASAPLSLESVTADPGTGVALPANLTTSIAITTAGAETNTLAVPSAVGKVLSLTLDVRVGGRWIRRETTSSSSVFRSRVPWCGASSRTTVAP